MIAGNGNNLQSTTKIPPRTKATRTQHDAIILIQRGGQHVSVGSQNASYCSARVASSTASSLQRTCGRKICQLGV